MAELSAKHDNSKKIDLEEIYQVIRALMAQRFNPQRDNEDEQEWDRVIKRARAVLPEFK